MVMIMVFVSMNTDQKSNDSNVGLLKKMYWFNCSIVFNGLIIGHRMMFKRYDDNPRNNIKTFNDLIIYDNINNY